MAVFEPMRSHPEASFAYYGPHEGWLVTLGVNRGSDQIERSNWRYLTGEVMRQWPDDAAIESMGHWAVGWVEYLLVKPDSPAVKFMSDWRDVLDIYPIANDADYEQLVADETPEFDDGMWPEVH
jgi:hypothetical protein